MFEITDKTLGVVLDDISPLMLYPLGVQTPIQKKTGLIPHPEWTGVFAKYRKTPDKRVICIWVRVEETMCVVLTVYVVPRWEEEALEARGLSFR